MKRLAHPALGILLVVLPAGAFQRVEALHRTQELPLARAVIDAHLEKAGLVEACSKTTSARLRGQFEVIGTGIRGPYEILAAKPNLQAFQLELGGIGTMLTGFDGDVGWEIHPMTGARLLHGLELEQTTFRAKYAEPLKPSGEYEKMKTLARVDFEGRPCWKLELVAKPGADVASEESLAARTTYDYYDVETGLFAGAEFTNVSAQGELMMKSVASEYERFGNRLVATKVVQEMPGQKTVLTVESLEYDVVELEAFEPPARIAKLAARQKALALEER